MGDEDTSSQSGGFTRGQLRAIVDQGAGMPSAAIAVEPIAQDFSSAVEPGVLTQARIDQLLEQHNCHRERYGLEPLKWDEDLARSAQAYADKGVVAYVDRGIFAHSDASERKGIGENLAVGTPASIDAKGWIEEERLYPCGDPIPGSLTPEFQKYGHWTQMLWSDTDSVGCGVSARPNASGAMIEFLACHYSPAGNIGGSTPVTADNCRTAARGEARVCPYQAGYVPPPPSAKVTGSEENVEEDRRLKEQKEAERKKAEEEKRKQAELDKKAAEAAKKAAAVEQAAATALLISKKKEQIADAVACRVRSCPPDNSIPREGESGLTQCEIDNIMCVHNKARAEVGVPPIVWDETLARAAAEYASKCTYPLAHWSTTDVPRPCFEYDAAALNDDPNLKLVETRRIAGKEQTDGKQCMVMGENLYIGSGCPPAASAVEFWYDEIECTVCGAPAGRDDCVPGKAVAINSCGHKPCSMCGHYTQMVWSSSRKIGCAKRKCGDKDYVVCEYFPGGNIKGHLPFACTVCDTDVGKKFKKVVECDLTLPVGEGVKLPAAKAPPSSTSKVADKPLDDLFPETRGPVAGAKKEQAAPEEPSSAVVKVPSAGEPVVGDGIPASVVDKETLRRAEERVARTQSQLDTARNSLAASQQTLDNARADLATVKGSIEQSEAALIKLRTDVATAVAQRTKAIADERDAVARDLSGDELFRFQAARQSAETIADRLQEQVKTLEEQLIDSSLTTKQIADLEALTAKFEADVDAARQEVQNAEAEYARAQQQLDNVRTGKPTDDAIEEALTVEQQKQRDAGLSPWLIALIVVGSVVLFVLVLLATFFFARRKDNSAASITRKTSTASSQGRTDTTAQATTMPTDAYNY